MAKSLIIDDDISTTYLLGNVSSQEGCEVYAGKNHDTALSEAIFIQPDLIFLDLIMLGMDRIGTCEILNSSSKLRQAPTLIVSLAGDIKSRVNILKDRGESE
jgi:DNA-binding response OmpR family regulator